MSVVTKLTPSLATMSRSSKQTWVEGLISGLADSKDLLCFSKTYWPYATKGKKALLAVGVNFTLIELDECGESRNGDIQKILHSINGCSTVPNIISSNGFIGGGSETEALHKNGQLRGILEAAGCAFGK